MDEILVDWDEFRATRTQLGAAFVRILGYFREDGTKSVAAIEEAMRARDARGLVMPAHTLKSEARQFGAERLGALTEDIEMFARHCVEAQVSPEEYLPRVVNLRALFEETLAALEREANPLVQRKPAGFGRAVGY
ncbi:MULTISPECIES: Hpt domain-containing protein [unclassified Sphingopyxis]|uniref:Hpt domain-containing protein n=1 Tax=Sphingopyxis sp. TaxID=1908224 RepID=UPI00260FFCD3|nr:Hpt domain-containing protein [Sphingopyxis sp.]MCW0197954.1 Hpt domain-containing protein [Sphingopyxis sp.]HEX2811497.1 Hpt domain-containing protein [Sphingopyxis sp.]HMN54422.1 Hpt domain-containing protein [Sphingopyxis sp.]